MFQNHKIKIAIAQLNSIDSFEKNFDQIETIVNEANSADEKKPDIIFFPENSLYFRIKFDSEIPKLELNSNLIKKIEKLSTQAKINFHITSSIYENNKNWNASLLFSPDSAAKVVYKKIHLFDITLNGDKSIRESDVFTHGSEITHFNINNFKMGSSICYDVRFSELYHQHALNEVDAILVPAAFLVKTGKAHWETLLRARAIESQCYVIAAAQTGVHKSIHGECSRETYGHSILISPWGEVIEQKENGVGLLYAVLDSAECRKVRDQIPMKDHRRINRN